MLGSTVVVSVIHRGVGRDRPFLKRDWLLRSTLGRKGKCSVSTLGYLAGNRGFPHRKKKQGSSEDKNLRAIFATSYSPDAETNTRDRSVFLTSELPTNRELSREGLNRLSYSAT